jgi:AbrB family looped-hinge helix DNA binding protein
MNARTKVSPNGDVAIPQDVRDRLAWAPGTPLEVVETSEGISLRTSHPKNPFPPKTLADLDALPRYDGPPQPIEAISRLPDEAKRRLLDERDRH